jgi:hypothetical protein
LQKGSVVEDNIPCGRCDIGVYCVTAMMNKTARQFGALSEEDRVKQMPRCKRYDRYCLGARDFHECVKDLDKDQLSSPQPTVPSPTNESP